MTIPVLLTGATGSVGRQVLRALTAAPCWFGRVGGVGNAAERSTIYIMNSNYVDEVKEMSGHAYEYIQVNHE
jgi:nucleoside-diphosphate-sugar epimerase